MKKKLHINIDETIALFDKKWEMLPETVEHVEHCTECSVLIDRYSEIQSVLISNRHVSTFPDMEKINSIAEKSFFLLHNEKPVEEKENMLTYLTNLFSSFLRPVAISAATIAVVIAVYSGINSKSETIETAQNDDTADTTEVQENENQVAPGLKKSGEQIKLAAAKIETLSETRFDMISENEISMGRGKAKFDVESGNDFRINVNSRFVVRVLGTSFVVDYNGSTLAVNVMNGLVEVVDMFDNSSSALSENMEKVFEVKTALVKKPATRSVVKTDLPKNIHAPKLNITHDASFLFQGREALNSGNMGAAIQLFMLEIEKGNEKDKALFEAVRIHENDKKYKEMDSLLKNNASIMNGSRVYREELMIKGCRAQKKGGIDLSLCREYLNAFPDGYRKNEIRELVNE